MKIVLFIEAILSHRKLQPFFWFYCIAFFLAKFIRFFLSHPQSVFGLKLKSNVETVFICGTGPSIRDLPTSDLSNLNHCLSIGINNVACSDLAVDFNAVEFAIEEEARRALADCLETKAGTGPTKVLYYHTGHGPAALSRNVEMIHYSYIRPPGASLKAIQLSAGMFQGICDFFNLRLVIGRKSTLERMVSLAIRHKPRQIVLCGIDLQLPRSGEESSAHPTVTATVFGESIFDFLKCLERIGNKHGISIKVGSNTSGLVRLFEPFDWKEKN